MESLSSYTISDVTVDQVKDYLELTEFAGITSTHEITKIILQMLSNGIEPQAIYHLCADIRNEKRRNKRDKKTIQ